MTGVRPPLFGGLREHAINHKHLIKDETLDFLISSVETATQTLVYACGGPMTQLARLVSAKPKNLEALRVLWIGGSEFSGVYPPGASSLEYNLAADPESVQIVFNSKELDLWHIPRDSYRRAVLSFAELNARLENGNPLQIHLLSTIKAVRQKTLENSIDIGETYCFGDSALVLLSVLENSFEPTPAGSEYFVGARRSVNLDGSYGKIVEGTENKTRVFSRLDTRLMFEDMFAKLGGHSGAL
jgi:inosine-uridine nucleoside N-ribohydrolase